MPTTGPSTILVIDDSLTVRKIVATCLRRAGYQVQEYSDAVQALYALARQDALRPVLIVLDINLPRLDGYECTRLLKGRAGFAGVPILLLSSRDSLLDRLKGRLVGASAYLTKPFQVQHLLAQVEWLLRQRVEPGEPQPDRTACH